MNETLRKLEDLCSQFKVASLYAFGSRQLEASSLLRGAETHSENVASDLDIAVMPVAGTRLSARDRVMLMAALEGVFGVLRVDLIVLPEADPFLALDAIRGELLFSDDLDRQAREELFVLRRAGDLAHFKKQRINGLLSGELRS